MKSRLWKLSVLMMAVVLIISYSTVGAFVENYPGGVMVPFAEPEGEAD